MYNGWKWAADNTAVSCTLVLDPKTLKTAGCSSSVGGIFLGGIFLGCIEEAGGCIVMGGRHAAGGGGGGGGGTVVNRGGGAWAGGGSGGGSKGTLASALSAWYACSCRAASALSRSFCAAFSFHCCNTLCGGGAFGGLATREGGFARPPCQDVHYVHARVDEAVEATVCTTCICVCHT